MPQSGWATVSLYLVCRYSNITYPQHNNNNYRADLFERMLAFAVTTVGNTQVQANALPLTDLRDILEGTTKHT